MNKCSQSCTKCENNGTSIRSDKLTKNLTTRLNRIEGQVKGVKAMIDRGAYCDDVLTQISAVQSAMSSVAKILLESHIRSCVTQKLRTGDETVVDELVKTVGRLL